MNTNKEQEMKTVEPETASDVWEEFAQVFEKKSLMEVIDAIQTEDNATDVLLNWIDDNDLTGEFRAYMEKYYSKN